MIAAVVVLLLGVVAALLLRDPGTTRADLDPGPAPSGAGDRDAAALALVDALDDALVARDVGAAVALAAPGTAAAGRQLADLVHNVEVTELGDLRLRYVGASATEPPTGVALASPKLGAWVADVEVTWRYPHDPGDSRLEVPVVLTWDGSETRILGVDTADPSVRIPLWLLDRVTVRRTARTLVVATTPRSAAALSLQARRAVVTVDRTLPGWRGRLVVEAPADADGFRSASGLSASAARTIAAVTTTTDGTFDRSTPTHVFVNPGVFGPLGPRGRQIVVSHETTHVAVDAVRTAMPQWLSEGFADYVALADSRLPVRVLASQILRLVRDDGPPEHLPGAAQFDGSDENIGAWYESAWVATRLVAQRYGEPALLRFYRAADAQGETARPFREVLGTTEARFEALWRAELVALARS